MGNPIQRAFRTIWRRRVSTLLRGSSRNALRILYRRFSIFCVAPKFRSVVSCVKDIDGIVEFAFSFRQYGISVAPLQVKEEILEFLKLVQEAKPKFLLEIGTARGGTLLMLTRIADPSATIISLDLPGGSFGGGYPKWKIPLYESFARCKQKIRLLRIDSHELSTLDQVKMIIGGSELDLLFIDGDHTYNGLRRDFEMYSPLVKRGGIIAFHDVLPHDKLHDPLGEIGADRFWRKLKKDHKCVEIVKNRRQGWAGIGILYA